ncbi:acetamidase/formamidase family protein [Spirillospora sp. CA-294931]|uniref:acetamidase/formamidase family protein n=1 Tax=Spirillospora sp. CA-294931 TaxID=3240042 RepID=UPI003D91E08F
MSPSLAPPRSTAPIVRPADVPPPSPYAVPGHDRWHPDIPAAAEVITGGSVRMECEARAPGADAVLCGPLVVVGAEPGDVIVVDVLAVGRADGRPAALGHPGIIGCAPHAGSLRAVPVPGAPEARLGRAIRGNPSYRRMEAESLSSEARGREIGSCAIAPLTAGARILLPVNVRGAKLSVGDLHFPRRGADDCRPAGLAGWIDLRINLTRRGVERFRVMGPLLMPRPA